MSDETPTSNGIVRLDDADDRPIRRDPETGRWLPGTRSGPGGTNPLHLARARFNAVLAKAVTPDDFRDVVAQLVQAAKTGEQWAVREFLDRTLGRAAQSVDLEARGAGVLLKIISGIDEDRL